jgi:hypothetical protein
MPDFFKGKPWDLKKFPPPNRDEFLGWLGQTQFPYVESTVRKAIQLLKSEGCTKFGKFVVDGGNGRYLWILLGW